MVRLAPSLACCDLLHVADEVRKFEENDIDLIHFDISDTSFCSTIMLPLGLIPRLKKFSKLPLDIHMMIADPEELIDSFKGCLDGNDYISVQVERTSELSNCLLKAKDVCKAGAVLNMGTPIGHLEYVAELLDMVILIQGNGGAGPRHNYPEIMARKTRDVRELLHRHGNDHCLISIDGNVTFESIPVFKEAGADVLVLGTRTVFNENSFADNVRKVREVLKQ